MPAVLGGSSCQNATSPATTNGTNFIPPGTVLPAELKSSLDSEKSRPGQTITARITQDVPLPGGKKIPAGARIVGHVVSVQPASAGQPAEITFRFDRLEFKHQPVPLI